ncbi:MAG: RES family NAD+ phosphorylase [Acidiphilium sp.]|nr:RES family NAD+ phosphorylase [Acidiphilium sp.]MDD4936928.1 RES family NAD+ phosphorylase [Acidiphilium sp.]
MIAVWRITKRRYADLSGTGAKLAGGRWNSPGVAVVYCADHSALAALEVRVHLDLPPELLPDDFVLMKIELPDEPPEEIRAIPPDPRVFGDHWIALGRMAVLRVPSILVPDAFNYLLNPVHPNAANAKPTDIRPFSFDARLWSGPT